MHLPSLLLLLLSFPTCRVLQGKSIRGPRWTGVSPLQGERGMFQRCRRGGSVIVIALLVIVIATAAAHKRRYSGVKGAFARTRRPHGSRRHPFARQRLFRRGKSFRTLGRLFLPSWDPGEHLQRRFDPGFIEQKSQGRQLRMKGPRVFFLRGGWRGRSKYCGCCVFVRFCIRIHLKQAVTQSFDCQLPTLFRQTGIHVCSL